MIKAVKRGILATIVAIAGCGKSDGASEMAPSAADDPAQASTAAGSGAAAEPGAMKPETAGEDPSSPTATPVTGDRSGADPMLGPETNAEPPETGECVLAMDECPELDTGWPGDEFCIAPPPADQGFQVHVGPPSYDNPPAGYLTQPGEDTNRTFTAVSGNTEEVFYYRRQYRMREGSHHMILSGGGSSGGFGFGGRRLGGSSNPAKDNPECGVIAPENEAIGMRLAANTTISFNLHYFNISDEPVLNEAWVNFWYKDPDEVKEEAHELFLVGDVGFAIEPGAHTIIGPNSASVTGTGRIITLYGHYHANTVRFSAWRTRGGQRDLILEDYDWHDPLILEYSSVADNPAPNPDIKTAGGWSGILDLEPGDTLSWECEVENMTNGTLRFTNEAVTGEMCILVGDTAGTTVGGFGGFGQQ